jgi:3-dehydrotetronate 4-kinase
MLIGVIADDFTGASDIANTLAKGHVDSPPLRVVQYLGVPASAASNEVEAGVIALKSRSNLAAEAVAQSLAALDWLLSQGCRQIVFKYCSTFDSTPEGNIGPVAMALAARLEAKGVVVCPAFPTMGRTIYQGHLFVQGRLLNESGMQNHPLTPMTDPDLRRWLARQGTGPVGLVAAQVVRQGGPAVRAALASAAESLVVVDAIDDTDLMAIGAAVAGARLVTGGSGIALGLARNVKAATEVQALLPLTAEGPGVILAGSCSGMTRRQIDHHRSSHPVIEIDVHKVMSGALSADEVARDLLSLASQAPLAFSSGTPEAVSAMQNTYGRDAVAQRLDCFFGDLAVALTEAGVRRLVVAGGETSGAVVSALAPEALQVGQEIDPGVPVLRAESGLVLALKSGNFGSVDFFSKALASMESAG